jgi:hypothetical protein
VVRFPGGARVRAAAATEAQAETLVPSVEGFRCRMLRQTNFDKKRIFA